MKLSRVCPGCDKSIIYHNKYTLARAIKEDKLCRGCNTTARNKLRLYSTKEKNSQWKGYKEIPFNWFSKYFLRGKKKRTGNITIQQVHALWEFQNRICALSKIPIGFCDDGKGHTCSIDRIDSSKEYVIDNIQLVHKDVNLMKNKFDQNYFIKVCKLISDNK